MARASLLLVLVALLAFDTAEVPLCARQAPQTDRRWHLAGHGTRRAGGLRCGGGVVRGEDVPAASAHTGAGANKRGRKQFYDSSRRAKFTSTYRAL